MPTTPLARLAVQALGPAMAALLLGCASSAPTDRGQVQGASASRDELVQSELNRAATLAMHDNLQSLMLLADKLYRRNPAQWRAGGATDREQALQRIQSAIDLRQAWAPLGGRRDIDAMAYAMSPAFTGDRVAALVLATVDMLITAHGGRTTFHLLDGIDAQHIHNAARNIEIAAWILSERRDAQNRPLLLANELSADGGTRNLSFEREFGKIIARLDLLAELSDERMRRAAINYVQSLLGAGLLQFLPVR
ncbi:MAG: hypothetical protein BGO13_04770 [Burkholderiales bacterium 66-5]|uniref:hypothetical protein n=1 Tax=Comamonas badia TaxID=265291 RepID=UPI00041CE4FE|nr:hypothetical protein [Comamonas badia]OJU86444.1 MAG: hypothetical protein BGO13_04770 [Burkholderiales bacterium 66-5]